MAGERELEPTAHRRAVERADPGLAAGLDAPIELRELAALVEHHLGRRFLALLADHVGVEPAHVFEHRQVGAAAECRLGGCNHHALDRGIVRHLVDNRAEFRDDVHGDDVHRAIAHVPCDERNAVAVDVKFEAGHRRFPRFAALVRLAVLFRVARALVVARHHHVDVRIKCTLCSRARADFDEDCITT